MLVSIASEPGHLAAFVVNPGSYFYFDTGTRVGRVGVYACEVLAVGSVVVFSSRWA